MKIPTTLFNGLKPRHRIALMTGIIGIGLFTMADSCSNSQDQANAKASNNLNTTYVPQHNLEFQNYNDRQKIADDPTTILWCTAYFPNPNIKPITIPIVGKLTSSDKRPFSADPGPDGMFGSSVEYRYGFTPAHVYVDFTGLSTLCTTQPTVYQATQTDIVLTLSGGLNTAANQARAALGKGNSASAEQILEQQIAALQPAATPTAKP